MAQSGDLVTPTKSVAGRSASALQRLLRFVRYDEWIRVLVATLVVGAVLAAAGGFDTASMPPVRRFAFWFGLMASGVGLGRLAARPLVRLPQFRHRPLLGRGLIVLVIGLPMTGVAVCVSNWMRGRSPTLEGLWQTAPEVLVTTAALTGLAFMVQSTGPEATHVAPPGAPEPRILARFPPRLRGASLWAVEAQDHYLRLHTSLGNDLILMRMADALVELEGIEGARTHRSWWVAREAVIDAQPADGRATLTLPGDLTAPVSRAYVKSLKEAGWW